MIFTSILIFLSLSAYFDIKYRAIPNKFLKFIFPYVYFLNLLDAMIHFNVLLWFLLIKFLILAFIFGITFALFYFKLIGGGDGKAIVIFFFSLPFEYLHFFMFYFFMLYGFFILLMVIINFISNTIRNRKGFKLISTFNLGFNRNQIILKMSCKLFNFSNLNKNYPLILENPILIYNEFKNKIQILIKFTYPLIVPLFFSYLVILMLITMGFL